MTNGVIKSADAVVGEQGVVIFVPLTSEPSNLDMSAATNFNVFNGGNFDSVLGYRRTDPLTANDRIRYQTISGMGAILTGGGQISIEVQRQWCCVDQATQGSIGFDIVGFQVPMTFTSNSTSINLEAPSRGADGSNNPIRSRVRNGASLIDTHRNSITKTINNTNGAIQLHSIGKGDFIQLTTNFVVNGLYMDIYTCIDGVEQSDSLQTFLLADLDAACFENLYIGERGGGAIMASNFYMRNLIVSTEHAVFDTSETYMEWGDSQVRDCQMFSGTPAYDNSQIWNFLYESARQGSHISSYSWIDPKNYSAGGTIGAGSGFQTGLPSATISDTGTVNLLNGIGGATRANVLSQNPTNIFFKAGTNDSVRNPFPTDYATSLAGHISAMQATVSIQKIILIEVSSFVGASADPTLDNATTRSNRDSIVNPSFNAATFGVVHSYDDLGQEVPPDGFTYLGQFGGGLGQDLDLHYAATAGVIEGIAMYTAFAFTGSAPTLTTPYDTLMLSLGATGSIDLGANWSGAATYSITGLPEWMVQDGTTGTVDYTNVKWGGISSDNTIGHGLWELEVQAIATEDLTTSTSIWLYARKP